MRENKLSKLIHWTPNGYEKQDQNQDSYKGFIEQWKKGTATLKRIFHFVTWSENKCIK